MKDEKWLAELKAGDEIAITNGTGARYDITKVGRTTATLIIVGSTKYRRSTGYRLGQHGYFHGRITPVTENIRHINAAQVLRERLTRLNTGKLSMKEIEAITATLPISVL